jgi:hypothetical protein
MRALTGQTVAQAPMGQPQALTAEPQAENRCDHGQGPKFCGPRGDGFLGGTGFLDGVAAGFSRALLTIILQGLALAAWASPCFADARASYTPPSGWAPLGGPGVTVSPPNYWQLRTTDIAYWPVLPGPIDTSDVEVEKRWNNVPLRKGWKLAESIVTQEHACAGDAWWIRRSFELPGGTDYRQIRLEFRRGQSMATLMYDLRSNSEKEDPTVLASFLDFCKRG